MIGQKGPPLSLKIQKSFVCRSLATDNLTFESVVCLKKTTALSLYGDDFPVAGLCMVAEYRSVSTEKQNSILLARLLRL